MKDAPGGRPTNRWKHSCSFGRMTAEFEAVLQDQLARVEEQKNKLVAAPLAEFAAASEPLVLFLRGVCFARGKPNPSRPAIAFLEGKRKRRFTVLRPLGTAGIIDPPPPL